MADLREPATPGADGSSSNRAATTTDDAYAHWSALHARGDLTAVGQSGLPLCINEWLYRNGARNLDAFLSAAGLVRPPATVFDVGAGTGYWVAYWLSRGAGRVDGCDLVPAAADALRSAYGATGTFVVADVAARGALADVQYDLVSCMNVLLHVLDEAAFDRAIANVAALVAPGGHLLLAEPIAADPAFATTPGAGDSSRVRSLARYAGPLEGAGLRLAQVRGTTVLGANPIEARPGWLLPLWRSWWGFVVAASRSSDRLGSLVGRLIYFADPMALRSSAAPSGKFALFRREQSTALGAVHDAPPPDGYVGRCRPPLEGLTNRPP